MSHTFEAETHGTTFIFNSDLSGDVEVVNEDGGRFTLSGDDLLEFIKARALKANGMAVVPVEATEGMKRSGSNYLLANSIGERDGHSPDLLAEDLYAAMLSSYHKDETG